jgi:hypothetical protein
MPPKKLSERSRTLTLLQEAVQRKLKQRQDSLGPASDCRRIDPKTGKVVEIIRARALSSSR